MARRRWNGRLDRFALWRENPSAELAEAAQLTYPIIPVDPASADATEHLGTKPKYWYVDATGDRRLFKAEDRGTGED